MPSPENIPLAIVGMACRLPGADNLEEYWELLAAGRSAIGEIPEDRLNRALHYSPDKGQPAKSYSTIGGLTSDWDERKSSIPVQYREQADAAHLGFCDVVLDACRDAGWDPFALPHRRAGVFVGHTRGSTLGGDLKFGTLVEQTAQYLREIEEFQQAANGQADELIERVVATARRDLPCADPQGVPNLQASRAAGLVAEVLGLDGPALCINAACASSLIALNMGANALRRGTADMVVVGGASHCKFDSLVLFSKAQSVSATGSRPFDENADGLVAAEGYVVLLMKTLAQAIADNDRVHAVIRGIGTSSDGKGKSLWAPRKEGQIKAVERAYGEHLEPSRLQYIEAHATSTQVGDATEVTAIAEALRDRLRPGQRIPLGSVKSNVGHTLESAGLAGLVKTVLSMQHGKIPPTINLQKPNSKIAWDEIPLFVQQRLESWPQHEDGHPRRAAVNAFGIGGLNVHVVLDEYSAAFHRQLVEAPSRHEDANPKAEVPVAIVGTSVIFPGAESRLGYWDRLRDGQDVRTTVPPERWRLDLGFEPGTYQPHRSYASRGGFSDFRYDWRKHKIPPKQLANADPLQFMMLQAVDDALRDAGFAAGAVENDRTGVLVGTQFAGEFAAQLQVGMRLPEFSKALAEVLQGRSVPQHTIEKISAKYESLLLQHYPALLDETGSFTSSTLASRITKTFDLMGGAAAVDAGTASALAVLDAAIDCLWSRQNDVMICVAGQRSLGLGGFESLALEGRLADDDSPAPWHKGSQGYLPAEGTAVIILKRLDDAVRDGDTVHAIVRGVGVSREKSLRKGLRTAMRHALDGAQVAPGDVACIETTPVGNSRDVEELEAIHEVFCPENRAAPLALGSIVGQFGHLGGASGMAALVKASLELHHATALGITAANKEDLIDSPGRNLALPSGPLPLAPTRQGRLYSGVTSIGEGNHVYHAILERAEPVKLPRDDAESMPAIANPARGARIVRIPGDSWDAIIQTLRSDQVHDAYARATDDAWAGGRVRLACVARSQLDFERQRKFLLAHDERPAAGLLAQQRIFVGEPNLEAASVAFVFPGQGSQYDGMLQSLVEDCDVARQCLNRIDETLAMSGDPSFAEMAWSQEERLGQDVCWTQLGMCVANTLMFMVLDAWKIRPAYISSHSYGEFPALAAAGCWSFEQCVAATKARSDSIEAADVAGGMLATDAPEEIVAAFCEDHEVAIANLNAPNQLVIGGRTDDLTLVAESMKAKGFRARMLAVPKPYHTPLMAGVQPLLDEALQDIPLVPPHVPFLSSVNNLFVAEPAAIRENLVAQMTRPVRFVDQIRRLAAVGADVFVEVGPEQVLTRLMRQVLPSSAVVVATDDRRYGAGDQLLCVRACVEVRGSGTEPTSTERMLARVRDCKTQEEVKESHGQGRANVLRWAGSPYEIGRQHGKECETAIHQMLGRYADIAGQTHRQLPDVSLALANVAAFFEPQDMEEMQGIADGAKVAVESIVAHNLLVYPDSELGIGGCVHFAVRGDRNSTGAVLHGANDDLPFALTLGSPLPRATQLRAPRGQMPHVLCGMAGQIGGINGFNAAGLTITSAMLLDIQPERCAARGRLHGVLVKRLLEHADSIEAAVAKLRSLPRTGAWSLCLSHAPTDAIAYLEYDGDRLEVEWNASIVMGANHSRLLGAGEEIPLHSACRFRRLEQLLSEQGQSLATEDAKRVLRDQFDGRRGKLTRHATMNTILRVDHQFSLLMESAHQKVWLATQGDSSFHALDLPDVFTSVPAPPTESQPARMETAEGGNSLVLTPDEYQAAYERLADRAENSKTVCQRFVMRLVETDKPPVKSPWERAGDVILLGGGALAEQLAGRIRQTGHDAVCLSLEEDRDSVLAGIERAWEDRPRATLVLLTPYDDRPATELASASWQTLRERGVLTPYFAAQRWCQLISQHKMGGQATILGATRLGGRFGFDGGIARIDGGAVAGLIKSLHVEIGGRTQDGFRAKVVDFSEELSAEQMLDALERELDSPDDEVEIGYVRDRRFVVRPVLESPASAGTWEIGAGSTWVVTGGARGVTAEVARELATRHHVTLHLLGSSPVPKVEASWRGLTQEEQRQLRTTVCREAAARGEIPIQAWAQVEKAIEIDANLRKLDAAGIRYTYHHCDISDREALAEVLAEVRRVDGDIDGIMHGAGFERACRFEKKKMADVERTIAAKLDGAAALMELTADDPLQFFCAFGSISGRQGAHGQTDYCVANDALAKLIGWYRERRPGCRSAVFHWHAWGEVGMAVRPESKGILERFQLNFMPTAEGSDFLIAEALAGNLESEIVVTEARRFLALYQSRPVSPIEQETRAVPAKPPLLEDWSRRGENVRSQVNFDPLGDPFLAEHRFKGRPLLPLVIGLEVFAETVAAAEGCRGATLEFENVEVIQPLRFFGDQPLIGNVHAEHQHSSYACSLTCDFHNRAGRLMKKDRLHLESTVRLGRQDAFQPATSLPDDQSWSEVWYPGPEEVIYHGAPFRCLRQAKLAADGCWWGQLVPEAIATLAGRRPATGWQLPVALLDACLFACGVYLWIEQRGCVAIPTGIDRLVVSPLAADWTKACFVQVRYQGQKEQIGTFDFDLFSRQGEQLLKATGYRAIQIENVSHIKELTS